MSSWKNAAKAGQRVHRERSQPRARRQLGPLEKKSDYVRRARHHAHQDRTIKLLSRRALDRNPDEFYHHMVNSKLVHGEHHDINKGPEDTAEQIKLMKTQDLKYVNMKRTIESNKIKRMQSELHMIDNANSVPNSHTFFVDDDEEVDNFDLVERLGTHPSLLQCRTNRLRLEDLETIKLPDVGKNVVNRIRKKRDKSYKELAKRIEREKQLTVVQQKLEVKKLLNDKKGQKPKLIKAGTKDSAPIYKWKYERKR